MPMGGSPWLSPHQDQGSHTQNVLATLWRRWEWMVPSEQSPCKKKSQVRLIYFNKYTLATNLNEKDENLAYRIKILILFFNLNFGAKMTLFPHQKKYWNILTWPRNGSTGIRRESVQVEGRHVNCLLVITSHLDW